jgi:hypothetical protein
MSYRRVDATVKYCIATPYNNSNKKVQQIIDFYEDNTPKCEIGGWKCERKVITIKDGLYGVELTKGEMSILLVLCEGDDNVYFVSNYKKHLRQFREDWGLSEAIENKVNLWTVT